MHLHRFWPCRLAVAVLAAIGVAGLAPSASAAPTSKVIRCTSGRTGFDFCKQLRFPIQRCRRVAVRILDSGDDRWIKVQVRKPGEDSSRWTSGALRPGQSQRGVVAGRDRFKPAIWVDAEGFTGTDVTMRLRFSGC